MSIYDIYIQYQTVSYNPYCHEINRLAHLKVFESVGLDSSKIHDQGSEWASEGESRHYWRVFCDEKQMTFILLKTNAVIISYHK